MYSVTVPNRISAVTDDQPRVTQIADQVLFLRHGENEREEKREERWNRRVSRDFLILTRVLKSPARI